MYYKNKSRRLSNNNNNQIESEHWIDYEWLAFAVQILQEKKSRKYFAQNLSFIQICQQEIEVVAILLFIRTHTKIIIICLHFYVLFMIGLYQKVLKIAALAEQNL